MFERFWKYITATPAPRKKMRGPNSHDFYYSLNRENWNKQFAFRCQGLDAYSLDMFEKCNFDFIFHYVIDGGALESPHKDEVGRLFRNTYEARKKQFEGPALSTAHNRLSKMLIAMDRLSLLSEEERAYWHNKFSTYGFDGTQPLFPQQWNRVWFFIGFGIDNMSAVPAAKPQICSYTPTIEDTVKQDLFGEEKNVMLGKFILMRSFCNQPLTEKEWVQVEKSGIESMLRKNRRNALGNMGRFYDHLRKLAETKNTA